MASIVKTFSFDSVKHAELLDWLASKESTSSTSATVRDACYTLMEIEKNVGNEVGIINLIELVNGLYSEISKMNTKIENMQFVRPTENNNQEAHDTRIVPPDILSNLLGAGDN